MSVSTIKKCIEQCLEKNRGSFIIYPYGVVGMQVKNILEDVYGKSADYIIDNHLYKYNSNIKPLRFLREINCDKYNLILASSNPKIYEDLKKSAMEYIEEENIIELNLIKEENPKEELNLIDEWPELTYLPSVGKYSYGSLCSHWLIESIGAFCSFGGGCDVVQNHAMNYLSTHPFLYINELANKPYEAAKNRPYYFPGILPKGTIGGNKIKIGNDVWFGKNVIITNGANIGNGVIAGAVITKDVPDYAVVVGVPARIIRYRYTSEQIFALNKIQWWNWTDDEIRERYDDFYLPIEKFIEKYWNRN